MRRRTRLVVACLVSTTLALTASQALGHPQANHYEGYWGEVVIGERPPATVSYSFAPSYNAFGNKRARARNAAERWNARNEPITFVNGPDLANEPTMGCVSDGPNSLHFTTIDGRGNFLAITGVCVVFLDGDPSTPAGNSIVRFFMDVDSQERWYAGTGSTPSTEVDLYGVLTHEFGHATGGWGPDLSTGADQHWGSGTALCDSDLHTMCPAIPTGNSQWRTLEAHDIHTFEAAY